MLARTSAIAAWSRSVLTPSAAVTTAQLRRNPDGPWFRRTRQSTSPSGDNRTSQPIRRVLAYESAAATIRWTVRRRDCMMLRRVAVLLAVTRWFSRPVPVPGQVLLRARQPAARSACPGTTTRKSAGRSGTSPRSRPRIEAAGGSTSSNDAKSSAETQATNVENLISQGADVLIILAQDADGDQAVRRQRDLAGHPGHRLRPAHRGSRRPVHHVRQRRGRPDAGAQPSSRLVPNGKYVIIKGNEADANARLPAKRHGRGHRRRRRPPATSRSSARPTPTTGIPPTPRPTWSSS